jgi:Asp-tRNA(Asn)/Glu-tRNA(Gln) amidotransferase A subunit family amidase
LAARIGADEVALPAIFEEAIALHSLIYDTGVARNYAREYERGRDSLGVRLRAMIENGQKVTALAWLAARDKVRALGKALDEIFADYEAILTPSAIGTAPVGIETTGSPIFCSLWTLCGTPALSLPLLEGTDGMPLGVQLVGARGDDARLLRTARWMTALAGR